MKNRKAFSFALLCLGALLGVPSGPIPADAQPAHRCLATGAFAAIAPIHQSVFQNRTLMTPEEFLSTIGRIRTEAEAQSQLPQAEETGALRSLAQAFDVRGDARLLSKESRIGFLAQSGAWSSSYAISILPYDHDTILSLLQYALASDGACIDPTFRYAVTQKLNWELHWRLSAEPRVELGEFYYDHTMALSEIAHALASEVAAADPGQAATFICDRDRIYELSVLVSSNLARMLGSDRLTPEQTESTLHNPRVVSTEAYRYQIYTLTKQPGDPVPLEFQQ